MGNFEILYKSNLSLQRIVLSIVQGKVQPSILEINTYLNLLTQPMKAILTMILSIFCFSLFAQQQPSNLRGNWTKGVPERFKGDVWVEYFVSDTTVDFLASRVLFEPNARSNWHKHAGKQIIFVISGEGYFKEKGKPLILLKKGDLVEILPGVIHSHGSLNNQFVQGVMMNGVSNKESTLWLNPVLEKELYEK